MLVSDMTYLIRVFQKVLIDIPSFEYPLMYTCVIYMIFVSLCLMELNCFWIVNQNAFFYIHIFSY